VVNVEQLSDLTPLTWTQTSEQVYGALTLSTFLSSVTTRLVALHMPVKLMKLQLVWTVFYELWV